MDRLDHGALKVAEVPRRWLLAGLALSVLMPALDTSIANLALPAIAHGFVAAFQQVQWIVLSYLLAITAFVVSAGRLGDIVGRRRLLLGGIALFTIASVACGLAPALPVLIAARAAQGLGAASMMAIAVALAGETVGKAKTGSAMGLLGSMSAVGTTVGPSVGGALIAGFGWRAIFLVNVPIGILNFALAYRFLPHDRSRKANARFDLKGTTLLALVLATFALAVTNGGGDFSSSSMALLAIAALGSAVFVRMQARSPSPLLRLELLRFDRFGAAFSISALVATVIMATLVIGPFYLSGALGMSPAAVGLAMSAGPLTAALAGVPAGRLVDRFGARAMGSIGLAGMTAGCLLLALLPAQLGVAGYVLTLLVVTSHYALFQAANNTGVMKTAAADQRGVVSGMLNLSRNLGLIGGASIMGTVFAVSSGVREISAASPAALSRGLHITFAVAALLLIAGLVLVCTSPQKD